MFECDQLFERFLEISEPLLPYHLGPLRLYFHHGGTMQVDRLPAPASEKYQTPAAALLSLAFDVAERFQLAEQISLSRSERVSRAREYRDSNPSLVISGSVQMADGQLRGEIRSHASSGREARKQGTRRW
jgi:hypothetical protein